MHNLLLLIALPVLDVPPSNRTAVEPSSLTDTTLLSIPSPSWRFDLNAPEQAKGQAVDQAKSPWEVFLESLVPQVLQVLSDNETDATQSSIHLSAPWVATKPTKSVELSKASFLWDAWPTKKLDDEFHNRRLAPAISGDTREVELRVLVPPTPTWGVTLAEKHQFSLGPTSIRRKITTLKHRCTSLKSLNEEERGWFGSLSLGASIPYDPHWNFQANSLFRDDEGKYLLDSIEFIQLSDPASINYKPCVDDILVIPPNYNYTGTETFRMTVVVAHPTYHYSIPSDETTPAHYSMGKSPFTWDTNRYPPPPPLTPHLHIPSMAFTVFMDGYTGIPYRPRPTKTQKGQETARSHGGREMITQPAETMSTADVNADADSDSDVRLAPLLKEFILHHSRQKRGHTNSTDSSDEAPIARFPWNLWSENPAIQTVTFSFASFIILVLYFSWVFYLATLPMSRNLFRHDEPSPRPRRSRHGGPHSHRSRRRRDCNYQAIE